MTLPYFILIWVEISWPPFNFGITAATSGKIFYSVDTVSMLYFLPICGKMYVQQSLTKHTDESPTAWFSLNFLAMLRVAMLAL